VAPDAGEDADGKARADAVDADEKEEHLPFLNGGEPEQLEKIFTYVEMREEGDVGPGGPRVSEVLRGY